MQLLLAADTATPVCSVALCAREPGSSVPPRLLAEAHFDAGRRHAESLLDTMDATLQLAGVAMEQIDLFAVACGPGSFTGLRIGVATWKGLAFALNRPLIAVPTLDAMTRLVPWSDGTVVCPMIDAKMSEIFASAYRIERGERVRLIEDAVLPPEKFLAQLSGAPLCIGDGAWLYRDRILEALPGALLPLAPGCAPRASALALEAYDRYDGGADTDPGLANPVYLRQPQVSMSKAAAAKAQQA